MSADNWGICPKCKLRHEARLASNAEILAEQYGKVDLQAYKLLEEKFNAVPEEYDEYELREDYEFVMFDDGDFLATYSAHCKNDACDFKFSFDHRETVKF